MKVKCLFLCLIVLTAAAFTLGLNVFKRPAAYAHAPTTQPLPLSLDDQSPTVGPVRNLRFTLFKEGIRPNEMRIKAGLVNILFEDKTHVAEGLMINRVVEDRRVVVGAIQKTPNQLRGRSSFRLTPGEYELYDASQPTNKAVLVVEP
jgi:hypothetical protein